MRTSGFILIVHEVIYAHGHENVESTNKTTFEITKDAHLTRRGDCIIAVRASKGAADLNQKFKDAARNENARIIITIKADEEVETVNAWGNPQLLFAHPTDLVVRKSNYVCGRRARLTGRISITSGIYAPLNPSSTTEDTYLFPVQDDP